MPAEGSGQACLHNGFKRQPQYYHVSAPLWIYYRADHVVNGSKVSWTPQ